MIKNEMERKTQKKIKGQKRGRENEEKNYIYR